MDPEIRFGARFNYKNFTSLSVGMKNGTFTAGAGIQYRFLRFDYSFGNDSYNGLFGAVHRFGITIKMGLTREQMLQIAEKKRRERERKLIEKTKEEERLKFVKKHLDLGDQYFKEGKYLDAYVEFQQVLSEDPFNQTAKAMLDSSDTMIQKQLEEEQKKAVSQAVDKVLAEETQKFVQEHYKKGRILLDQKRFTEALIQFNLALRRDPNNKIVKAAIRTAKDRLRLEIRQLLNRARSEYAKGNFADALRILNDALVIAPDDPNLKREIQNLTNSIKVQQFVQEGLIYYDLGQYDKALKSFEEALKLEPGNEVIRNYLEKSRASTMVRVEKMDPESEREYLHGVDLFLSGKYDEALAVWSKLKEKYPYNKKVLDAIRSAEERIKRLRKQK
jgi:tetratricopeptide (TPR) repeat protein